MEKYNVKLKGWKYYDHNYWKQEQAKYEYIPVKTIAILLELCGEISLLNSRF